MQNRNSDMRAGGPISNRQRNMNDPELDEALNHFNWGACFFLWVWGLGNGCFKKTFLPWVPVFVVFLILTIVLSFFSEHSSAYFFSVIKYVVFFPLGIIYGQKGNKWAYENRAWWSMEDFTETQKRWGIAVIAFFGFCFLIFILMFIIAKIIRILHF